MKKMNKRSILTAFCMLAVGTAMVGGVTAINASAAVTGLNDVTLTMNSGASVRIEDSLAESGMRYRMSMDKTQFEDLEKLGTVGYGMFLAPANYVDDTHEFTVENLFNDGACYYWEDNKIDSTADAKTQNPVLGNTLATKNVEIWHIGAPTLASGNDSVTFTGSIINFATSEADLLREYVCRGYISLTVEGKTTYKMANYAGNNKANNTRSMTYVAQVGIENDKDVDNLLLNGYVTPVSDVDTTYVVETYKQNFDGGYDKTVGDPITAKVNETVTTSPAEKYFTIDEAQSEGTKVYANGKSVFKRYYSLDYAQFDVQSGDSVVVDADYHADNTANSVVDTTAVGKVGMIKIGETERDASSEGVAFRDNTMEIAPSILKSMVGKANAVNLYTSDYKNYSATLNVWQLIKTESEFTTLTKWSDAGELFALANDIDFSGSANKWGTTWNGAGHAVYFFANTNIFKGVLDGREHEIKGITMTKENVSNFSSISDKDDRNYLVSRGVLGYVSGEIKNLKVTAALNLVTKKTNDEANSFVSQELTGKLTNCIFDFSQTRILSQDSTSFSDPFLVGPFNTMGENAVVKDCVFLYDYLSQAYSNGTIVEDSEYTPYSLAVQAQGKTTTLIENVAYIRIGNKVNMGSTRNFAANYQNAADAVTFKNTYHYKTLASAASGESAQRMKDDYREKTNGDYWDNVTTSLSDALSGFAVSGSTIVFA